MMVRLSQVSLGESDLALSALLLTDTYRLGSVCISRKEQSLGSRKTWVGFRPAMLYLGGLG